jgi:hypothetical protein
MRANPLLPQTRLSAGNETGPFELSISGVSAGFTGLDSIFDLDSRLISQISQEKTHALGHEFSQGNRGMERQPTGYPQA